MTTRREFIRNTAMGSAALAAVGLSPRRIAGQEQRFRRLMFRQLGITGWKTTEIGFGCMNNRDADLFRAGLDSGINYFDTGNSYMNGVNEQLVGEALAGRRDEAFLATKVGLSKDPDKARSEMDESLSRLKVDHVDLLQFHKVDEPAQATDERFMRLFEDARDAGKTRFMGITTHMNQAAVIDAAVESGFWEAILTGYNYFSPKELTDAIRRAREAGIAIIAMKTLITTERPRVPFPDIRPEGSKLTNQQALLAWVLENRNIDVTIPGITTFEQLNDDIAVMGLELSFEDRGLIRRYGDAAGSRYCRGVAGCTGCHEQCPYGVDVCEINRCLNYADGYGDRDLARENYRALPAGKTLAACEKCGECTVRCVNGLDIRERIGWARRLFT